MTGNSPASPLRLVLVYNADSGIINALVHAVHKQLSPSTYPCSLCAITYGAVSMHREWRRFLDDLAMDVAIYHKDEFEDAFPGHNIALPAILIGEGDALPHILIPAAELDIIHDTEELIERVKQRLDSHPLCSAGRAAVA